jgi:hypothetical protein
MTLYPHCIRWRHPKLSAFPITRPEVNFARIRIKLMIWVYVGLAYLAFSLACLGIYIVWARWWRGE